MNPSNPAIADLVERLSEGLREDYEERAGIIEFDANKTRVLAECLALLDVLRRHPGALLGVTPLQLDLDGVAIFVLTTTTDMPSGAIRVVDLAGVVAETFGGTALLTRFG